MAYQRRSKRGFVYFVQIAPDGPIKIGCTRGSPLGRMNTLKSWFPYELKLHGAYLADFAEERRFHKLFADHQIRGEWFHPHPEILNHIRENLSGFDLKKIDREIFHEDLFARIGKMRRSKDFDAFLKFSHREKIDRHDLYCWREKKRIPTETDVRRVNRALTKYDAYIAKQELNKHPSRTCR